MPPNRPLSAREEIARKTFAEVIETLKELREPLHRQAPPLRKQFWENMAAVLNPDDVEFVRQRQGVAEGEEYRHKQVEVYRLYIKQVKRDFAAFRARALDVSKRTDEWDVFRDRDLQMRGAWLFFRLRLASIVYLAHSPTGERISREAIAEMRLLLNPA